MPLPIAANTTCDVYHHGNAPPAAPSIAAVPCHVSAHYAEGIEANEGGDPYLTYTHIMLVEDSVAMTDDWRINPQVLFAETVYVPDQNGTPFRVVYIEKVIHGTRHKRVFLVRKTPNWATNEL